MKITGTKSYIVIETEGKTLKIEGELTTTPAFYADKKSIQNWEKPNESIKITEEEKETLIEKILIESNKDGNVKIIFE
ncbi:Imm74 family immunity protein [Flagellimonas sp. CMM7]|uniref:Imm74 family immunity protein n=1 Tax=Flagellimonas sp. CMM7 TaxID=2654676 RepID=UPI0013D8DF14|nr:Imm74 family immunity protein [Flagellimonas sp. CMM7]UII79689.1 immunity 74 family protein [Flagellimonas sp. CMM7]